MNRKIACLLALILALTLPVASLAEALPDEGDAPVQAEQPDAEALDLSIDLDRLIEADGVDVPEVSAGEASEEETPSEEGAREETPQTEDGTQEETPQTEEETQEEAPSIFGDPIATKTINVTKTASKSVYLGISYVLNVKGDISKASSSAKSIATVAKDGTVTLKKEGTASITITRKKGSKIKLTLKVKAVPAPGNLAVRSADGAMALSWSAAKYATGYLVQYSTDGKSMEDFGVLDSSARSADVTDVVNGTTWFRVVAILGDRFGGTSDTVSVLAPIDDVKVICQESEKKGPSNKMNVTWSACIGAEEYEVYHATLPSGNYTLIGTTQKTWFPVTRSLTKLDAYRVKPVCAGLDLPASDPVTLWTGVQDNVLPPKSLTSKTGIILVVNKDAQVVTAYVKDADGNYTLPLRHMLCSTGRVYDRTKNGTYKLKARVEKWHQYSTGVYIRWPSIYRDGYYFHSPLYSSSKSIMMSTVRALGTRQSEGCVRLKVRDAEWVFKNCPKGTAVYICNGAKKKSLVKAIKVKSVSVKGF